MASSKSDGGAMVEQVLEGSDEIVDDPLLTFEADTVESDRLTRLRQSRILRFQIRWMETLAEHAKRELAGLQEQAQAALPQPEDLQRAALEQAAESGEVPRRARDKAGES